VDLKGSFIPTHIVGLEHVVLARVRY
jgi:hypothetical protein